MSGRHEFTEVMRAAIEAVERGERVALATVVRVRGSAPRHEGARMLVWPDGRTLGTVGGATLEEKVIAHARQALEDRHGRLESYPLTTGGEAESLGLCGGVVDVHIEIIEKQATLVILGAGHVARPLARMAHEIGMRIVIVDDRPEAATTESFPQADVLGLVPYDPEIEALGALPLADFGPDAYVVVATWGWDEPALAQILPMEPTPAYIGLVASPTKHRVIRERLAAQGLPESALDRLTSPTGLDLGAETPAEIALSILAEVLAVRRKTSGVPLSQLRARKTTQP